jgi:hypothetical protein
MADNSFGLNESGMIKPVKSENLQGRKNFADVYESVSSSRSNPEDKDVKKGKLLKKGNPEKALDMSSKSITDGEEKPVGSKKTKTVNVSKKIKAVNSRALREKLADLSLSENTGSRMTEKSTDMENIISDISEELIIPDQKILKVNGDDVSKSDNINNVVNSSEILILEQSKLSAVVSPVNEKKSEKLSKRPGEKSTVKNEISGKQGKLSVLDLRESRHGLSKIEQTKTKQAGSSVALENQKLPSDQLEQMRSDSNEAAKPIVVELTHVKDNFSGESKTLTTTTGSALMKQLEESVNNKIVKQSSIILKNDNSGEIKLILKPEALGKVRIRLSLNDNRIAGQIIVENSAVKEIFEQNLQNLERAFKENGFDTAALNVSVGGDGAGSGDRKKNGDIAKQIEMINEIIPTIITESDNLIDLIA